MAQAGGVDRKERFRAIRIWRSLDAERRLEAATAFWKSGVVKEAEVEAAVAVLAQTLRFRPQSIRTSPLAKRASLLANHAAVPDHLAASLLYAYHLVHQVPMMSRFLDLLGIAHEEGRITEGTPKRDRAALEKGVETLLKEFPPTDVVTYLEVLVSQDEETWGDLAGILPSPPPP